MRAFVEVLYFRDEIIVHYAPMQAPLGSFGGRSSMSRSVFVLSLILVTVSSLPATAQETPPPPPSAGEPAAQKPPAEAAPEPAPTPRPASPKVNALAEARAARAAGDHLAAARAFEAMYAAKCDPMLLYDIAVQLEDGGEARGALAYYSRFMAEAKKAPNGLRQSVGPRIAELVLELKRQGQSGSEVKTVACGDQVTIEAKYSGPRPKPFVKPSPAPATASADEAGATAGGEATSASEESDEGETYDAEDPKAGVLLELQLLPGSEWRGGFFIGASFARFALGVGLEAYELPLPGGAPNADDTAPTAVLLTPGVRIRMAQSSDAKIECLAAFNLGLGTTFGGEDPAGTEISTLLINWRLGPVLRYWLHSQLAVALWVGMGAEHVRLSITQSQSGAQADHNYSDVATFGALQLIGRF